MPLKTEPFDMEGFEENYTQVLEEAENVIRQCFKDHNLDEIFISFNGGKDCTVLLDITINTLKKVLKTSSVNDRLKVVYIRTESSFQELEEFVEQTERHYGLKLMTEEGDLKTTLQRIMDQDDKIKACLMGTRKSDPFSENLNFMQKTDENWPQILRVSPLLNWSYHQIWTYILKNRVPYCSLYNQGYSSIGSTYNTQPNPALTYKDSEGGFLYLPAWKLRDGALERAGRGNKPNLLNLPNDKHNNSPNDHDESGHSQNGNDGICHSRIQFNQENGHDSKLNGNIN